MGQRQERICQGPPPWLRLWSVQVGPPHGNRQLHRPGHRPQPPRSDLPCLTATLPTSLASSPTSNRRWTAVLVKFLNSPPSSSSLAMLAWLCSNPPSLCASRLSHPTPRSAVSPCVTCVKPLLSALSRRS